MRFHSSDRGASIKNASLAFPFMSLLVVELARANHLCHMSHETNDYRAARKLNNKIVNFLMTPLECAQFQTLH